MSEPIVRYWDKDFNEISLEEWLRAKGIDSSSVAITFQESDK